MPRQLSSDKIQDILRLARAGLPRKSIARRLHIEVSTVERHCRIAKVELSNYKHHPNPMEEKEKAVEVQGDHGARNGGREDYKRPRRDPATLEHRLPVIEGSFIKPPTLAQLMGRR